jgi:thioester reductase-like protein
MSSSGRVLLTGATGFVGMEVLARYLEHGDREVTCLIRAESDEAARGRLDPVLRNLFGWRADRYAARVEAVAGELTAPGLGLSPARRDELAAQVTTIVHSAASVSFTLPIDEARAINVEGTRRMLEFAALAKDCGGLDRYAQVSTAYVAGTHSGRFSEADLDVGQDFRNTYEQSKFEAERMVRTEGEGLPWMILRPSIVVGDCASGWTSAFNVLYWPLRAFSAGVFKTVPATPETPVDVVSIDYVADAIHELCEAPCAAGQTYLLTAGAEGTSTMGEIAAAASRYFRRPLPKVVSPAEFTESQGGLSEAALESSRVFFPYFSMSTVFDNAMTRARLSQVGINAMPLNDYFERLLDFATRTRWGKRPIGRAEAHAT